MRPLLRWLGWLSLNLGLVACGGTVNAPLLTVPAVASPTVTLGVAPVTFTPAPTALASFSPTPAFVATQGIQTPTPAATPAPCINSLEFISDVSVPDGAQYLPSQTFVKKWAVRNNGTCDWGSTYRLVLLNGSALGERTEVALYPAKAGTEATLEIPMAAPLEPGNYTGRWQARAPNNELFGAVVFIKIEVIPLPAVP